MGSLSNVDGSDFLIVQDRNSDAVGKTIGQITQEQILKAVSGIAGDDIIYVQDANADVEKTLNKLKLEKILEAASQAVGYDYI